MVANEIVERKVGASVIPHRMTDGYINATVMCQAFGKDWFDYWRISDTQNFLAALSAQENLPLKEDDTKPGIPGLVQSARGGRDGERGTWVHPYVAVDLARWCSPQFGAIVAKWVGDWLMRGAQPAPAKIIHRAWSERLSDTFKKHRLHVVQNFAAGCFTTYTAAAIEILMIEDELNSQDVPLKYGDLPDGSMGKCFANYVRDNELSGPIGTAPLDMPHLGLNGIVVSVAVYGTEMRPIFDKWLKEIYVPQKMPAYFANKPEWKRLHAILAVVAQEASMKLTGTNAVLPSNLQKALPSPTGGDTAEMAERPDDREE